MEPTFFSKLFPCNDSENRYILFSTKTGGKLLLEPSVLSSMRNGTLPETEQRLLAELGFLVPDRQSEILNMPEIIAAQNRHNPALSVTAVMNLDCNFSCTYCYEGSRKGHKYMTKETARQFTAFVKKRFDRQKNALVINFFGGEPLLSIPLIEQISADLKSFAEGRNARYGATMITNGSLLKRPVAEKLAALGLESVKITLDGPGHIHDRYRPFRSGKGSFDIILDNILNCRDVVAVNIGGNYNPETYPDFIPLLDLLENRGLTPDKLGIVKFDPIFDAGEGPVSMPEHRSGCASINEPWILEAEECLRGEILRRGYKIPKVNPMICAIEHQDQFVVNYNGDIYKCPGFLGHEQFVIGNLREDVGDYSDTYQLDIWKREPCLNCVYLPMCYGGCRYWTFLRNGKIDDIDCKKPYLDAQLECLVKQDIEFQR